MSNLRNSLIRLAHANKGLRSVLLPLIKESARGPRLDAGIKRKINHQLTNLTTPGNRTRYFDKIPLEDITAILTRHGVIMLQEDNTPWSGFLLGDSSEGNFTLAPITSDPQYEPFTNTVLRLSWHKMSSGRYEIVTYVA